MAKRPIKIIIKYSIIRYLCIFLILSPIVIPSNKNPDQILFLFVYVYFYAYILARIHLRMIRPLYTYFETQTVSYLDSASCIGIMTEPAMLFSDQHESGLSRVVCIGWNTVMYLYVHVCTLFSSTRLSRLKPQCSLDLEDTLRPWRIVYRCRVII